MAKKKKRRKHTPITSKAQQGLFGVVRAAQKGKKIKGGLRGPAKKAKKSLTVKETRGHLKESKGKKLPARKRKKK